MVKISPRFLIIVLVAISVFLIGGVVNAQSIPKRNLLEAATAINAKQELTKTVLSALEMPKRYDLYLGNSVDAVISPEMAKNKQFISWLQGLFVQQAGWKYVEDIYMTQLETSFSEAELKELSNLVKQPLIQKLLQSESKAYAASTDKRRQLLAQLWEDYNNNVFTPPPGTLP